MRTRGEDTFNKPLFSSAIVLEKDKPAKRKFIGSRSPDSVPDDLSSADQRRDRSPTKKNKKDKDDKGKVRIRFRRIIHTTKSNSAAPFRNLLEVYQFYRHRVNPTKERVAMTAPSPGTAKETHTILHSIRIDHRSQRKR